MGAEVSSHFIGGLVATTAFAIARFTIFVATAYTVHTAFARLIALALGFVGIAHFISPLRLKRVGVKGQGVKG